MAIPTGGGVAINELEAREINGVGDRWRLSDHSGCRRGHDLIPVVTVDVGELNADDGADISRDQVVCVVGGVCDVIPSGAVIERPLPLVGDSRRIRITIGITGGIRSRELEGVCGGTGGSGEDDIPLVSRVGGLRSRDGPVGDAIGIDEVFEIGTDSVCGLDQGE